MAGGGRAPSQYAVLGVPREATTGEIRAAYRKLALKWHPDKRKVQGADATDGQSSEDANAMFRQIQEAYQVLSDASRRAMYDLQERNHLLYHQQQQQQRHDDDDVCWEDHIYSGITRAWKDDGLDDDILGTVSGLMGDQFEENERSMEEAVFAMLDDFFNKINPNNEPPPAAAAADGHGIGSPPKDGSSSPGTRGKQAGAAAASSSSSSGSSSSSRRPQPPATGGPASSSSATDD